MPKSSTRRSARRKPLSDVSNSRNGSRAPKQNRPPASADTILDRLLFTHTRLSKILVEIDELVVRAFEHGMTSKTGISDIESFVDYLSNMCSGLKPWIPRFKGFADSSIKSVDQIKQSLGKAVTDAEECPPATCLRDSAADLVVSPSPLVSWRTGTCAIECGKQLFLLTPLPKTKVASSKLKTTKSTSYQNANLLTTAAHVRDELPKTAEVTYNSADTIPETAEDRVALASKHGSPSNFSMIKKSKDCSTYLLTPCLKSSLRNGKLLDSISEAFQDEKGSNKSTHASDAGGAVTNDSSCKDTSKDVEFKCIELLAFDLPALKTTSQRQVISDSLEWCLSPPKTCIPLEPPGADCRNVKTVESSPMLYGLESTIQKGRKGETTLKRELWMKFEAVSGPSPRVGASVAVNKDNKGFLDMLEEVSSDMPCFE